MTALMIKPFRSALFPLLLSLLLAAGLTTPAARGDNPPPAPLPLPLVQMDPSTGSDWAAVQAAAAAEAVSPNSNATPPINGGQPSYRSTQLEQVSFEGDFTPDINHTKLAIHSDDGANVYIDGSEVLSRKGQGQTLEKMDQSLYPLSTLNAGQTYHIRIDYQNSWYDGDGDIDGVTLFAYSDPPVVTLDLGGVSGGLTTDVENSGPITASATNAPQSTSTCQVTGEDWEWDFADVEYSSDGGKIWDASPDPTQYYMQIDNAYVQSTNFDMTVYQDGDWATSLTAIVTYHTTCGDISATATDWVGTSYTASSLLDKSMIRHQRRKSFCPHIGKMTAARYYPNAKPLKKRLAMGTKGFYITNSVIEPSQYKGPQLKGQWPTHPRHSDDSIQTDSVAFYGNGQWIGDQGNFIANPTTYGNYAWGPDGGNHQVLAIQAPPPAAQAHYVFGLGTTAPFGSDTISCKSTDTTGKSVNNTFQVTWHLPHEPVGAALSVTAGREKIQAVAGPIPSTVGHDKAWTCGPQGFVMPTWISSAVKVGGIAGGLLDQPEVAGICSIAGVGVDEAASYYKGSTISGVATNDSGSWNDALHDEHYEEPFDPANQYKDTNSSGSSSFPTPTVDNNIPDALHTIDSATGGYADWHEDCYLYMIEVSHYHESVFNGDDYGKHGYLNPSPYIHYHRIDNINVEPFFAQSSTISGH